MKRYDTAPILSPTLIRTLQGIVILGGLGVLVIQGFLIATPFFAQDSSDNPTAGLGPYLAIIILVLGFLCVEVALVAVWRLLGFVGHGTVFSPASLRWVDLIIGAVSVAAALVLILSYVVAQLDDAPGLVVVGAVLALLVAGVALVVWVQRMLLVQATSYAAELEQVI